MSISTFKRMVNILLVGTTILVAFGPDWLAQFKVLQGAVLLSGFLAVVGLFFVSDFYGSPQQSTTGYVSEMHQTPSTLPSLEQVPGPDAIEISRKEWLSINRALDPVYRFQVTPERAQRDVRIKVSNLHRILTELGGTSHHETEKKSDWQRSLVRWELLPSFTLRPRILEMDEIASQLRITSWDKRPPEPDFDGDKTDIRRSKGELLH